MTSSRLTIRAAAGALVLTAVRAAALCALQLGGVVDLGTGPAAWDRADAGSLTQGALGASYRTASLFGLQPELAGGFGLSSEPGARTAVRWDLGGRLHTRGRSTGVWIGAAVGGAGVGAPSASLTRLEGGVRQAIGPAGVHVWVMRTTFGSVPVARGGLGQDGGPASDTLVAGGGRRVAEYTDLGSRATLELGRYELGALLVRRLGGVTPRRTGWELSGVWWLDPGIGLVGSVGHSLPQFGVAVPGARYGTVGVRLALGASPRGFRLPAPPRPDAGAPVRLVLAAARRLAIVGPAADSAEVMGDFTDWQPRPLVPDGEGRWTLGEALSPGVHQLNVRFDGGPWLVPAGAADVDDGFGGRVGLFVVR